MDMDFSVPKKPKINKTSNAATDWETHDKTYTETGHLTEE